MKNLKKKILVSTLCLLPILASGCDLSINVNEKDQKETIDNSSTKSEELNINESEVQNLIKNTFFSDNYEYADVYKSEMNDIYFKNHFDISNMTNYQRNVLVTLYYNYKKYTDSYKCSDNNFEICARILDVDKYEKYTKEIFGPSYNYVQPTTTDSNEHTCVINYEQERQKYVFYNCGMGGPNIIERYNKAVSAKKDNTNNLITINIKSFYTETRYTDNGETFVDVKANGQLVDSNNSSLNNIDFDYDTLKSKYNELFDNYLDKAEEYQFTFKLDGNNYYLFSIDKL